MHFVHKGRHEDGPINRLRASAQSHPRRWPWIAALVVVLIGSGVALALLISRQDAAPQTISAQTIGEVNIGDAVDGVFTASLSGIAPGFETCQWVTADLIDPQDGDVARLWVIQADGDLAADLEFDIRKRDSAIGAAAGRMACGTLSSPVDHFSGSLSTLKAAAGSFAAGFPFRVDGSGVPQKTMWEFRLRLPETADPEVIAGRSAVISFAFENRA